MESEMTWQDVCSFTGQRLGYGLTEPVPSASAHARGVYKARVVSRIL
jgi:hypothetical protein